ncbi:TonB-dependent receptor [Parabacteroides sp. AM08-6]|uniref:TonB-dependent receptor n=1 Tax=Parabacteroides sp. AM08-6 TaxID=2292053 RepID=UPI000F005A6C|nr:TonB-dependent receptor [Parabacteroides sp. AM08-6]RHJ86690.1 TonB-dependent receptor [Parabacteroides sp. AM08-6]
MKRYLYLLIVSVFVNLQLIKADERDVQINDTIKTYNIDEIIVTSSTKETNDLRTLPGSVSILSPQAIAVRQIDALKDISAFVPNLYMPDYGSKMTSAIYIRGIGARSSGQSIGLYVDNVPYLDKSTFDFELNDIQRIEILRGPQGTLYGRNAMGGIVNIYTLSPFNYQGTKLSVSGGNYGTFNVKASHYNKINNHIGIAIGGYYNRSDGFFINECDNSRADKEQSAGGRFKLDWLIADNLEAQYSFNYDYVDQKAFPYGMYNIETGTVAPIRINDPSSYWRKMLNNSLHLEWNAEKFTLSSTTAYQRLHDNMKMDQDYTEKSIFVLNQIQKQYAWSEEIAIKSNHKKNYQWSFGAYGFYNSLNTDGPVIFKEDGIREIMQIPFDEMAKDNPDMPQLTVTGDALKQIYFPGTFDTPTYGFAAFHQSTYNNLFVEGLSLTAGIRLDYEKAKMKYDSAVDSMNMSVQMGHMNMNLPVAAHLQGDISQDFLQVLPKASLRYQCTPETFTYFSVAKGYKTGGYNVQMFGDLVQAQATYDLMKKFMPDKAIEPGAVKEVASYKPEHSWNYEIGIRSELIKNRLNTELTLFYMNIRDIQLTTFAQNGSGRMITNGGKANSYGVEMSLRARIIDGLTADVNYGFTRATFRDYIFKEKDLTETDCKGNFIPYTPRHTVSIGVQYTRLFRNSFIDQFMVSAQYSGAGKIYWTEKNSISQDFYGTLNGKIGIRKGIVKLNVWSRNITDTNYQAFYFESFGNSFIQKGKPFQIGAEVAVAF